MQITISDDPDWNHPDAWLVDEVTDLSQEDPDGRRRVTSFIMLTHGLSDTRIRISVPWPNPGQSPQGLKAVRRAWLEQIPVHVDQPVGV